jgi:subfamily B ATP-binding cassette protein MsbA
VDVKNFTDRIEYRKVSFSYVPGRKALDSISLTLKKGSILALVGPSGSGKSTLADLLARFYDPQEGAILLDGRELPACTIASLRGLMGIVTQETILFNDSVRNNIAYGKMSSSQDEVESAARAAYADGFIRALPQGYQTLIGERGVRLSGGERQRLAIARAILKNPPILIFDEATSALDSESEQEVQKAIEAVMQDRTTVVIAHRLSTIQKAERILVLDEGRLVEQGTHQELLDQNGLYRKLYDMQFKK